MPLGDAWSGECRARAGEPFTPERAALLERCNMGYARGGCARFADNGGPDAARFAVTRHEAAAVTLCCVLEKDYLPFSRAGFSYSLAERRFTAGHPDACIERQAWAYLQSYLLRKNA